MDRPRYISAAACEEQGKSKKGRVSGGTDSNLPASKPAKNDPNLPSRQTSKNYSSTEDPPPNKAKNTSSTRSTNDNDPPRGKNSFKVPCPSPPPTIMASSGGAVVAALNTGKSRRRGLSADQIAQMCHAECAKSSSASSSASGSRGGGSSRGGAGGKRRQVNKTGETYSSLGYINCSALVHRTLCIFPGDCCVGGRGWP